ncbi:hypothetical protein [Arthrobacter sp. USHLN218]|uniref:hypothetical protein n=1 Tax=Arthrobacter sp. USHLN218 TaxID=3081232 RepID=UPI00301B527B
MSNRHYDAAVSEKYAGDWRFTEATLAVAYEARTANLLALAALKREAEDYTAAAHLEDEARARL